MNSIQKMSDAEAEVMRVIWAAEGPVTSQAVLAELNKRKDWKPTTVLTFLSRLTEKGLLRTEKRKRSISTPRRLARKNISIWKPGLFLIRYTKVPSKFYRGFIRCR